MKEFIDRYKTGFQSQDWIKTGLLSSLAPDQEPQVIELFEKAMDYILKNEGDSKNEYILPIIRKVYVDIVTCRWSNDQNKLLLYHLINVNDLLKHFYSLYESVMPSFYEFKYIDGEAELCQMITRDYVNKLSEEFLKNKSDEQILSNLIQLSRNEKINTVLNNSNS
jgi:hypothetical protein